MGKHLQEGNLKTINGNNIVGEGDINIGSGGAGGVTVHKANYNSTYPSVNDTSDIVSILIDPFDTNNFSEGDIIVQDPEIAGSTPHTRYFRGTVIDFKYPMPSIDFQLQIKEGDGIYDGKGMLYGVLRYRGYESKYEIIREVFIK